MQLLLTWITTFIEQVLFGGSLIGWPSLNEILINEGYFRGECPEVGNVTEIIECNYQVESLSLVFTISYGLGLGFFSIVGTIMDYFGGWFARTMLLSFSMIGYIVVIVSTPETSYLLYIAFTLIGISNLGLLVTNSQLANLFSKYKATFTLSTYGGFCAGSAVFLIMNLIYFSGTSFKSMFLFYFTLNCTLNFRTFLFTPRSTIPHILPSDYRYGFRELICFKKLEVETNQSAKDVNAENQYVLDKKSLKSCLLCTYTWTNMISVAAIQLINAFFTANLNTFLTVRSKGDKEIVKDYIKYFGIMQCSSVFIAIGNGWIVDKLKNHFAVRMQTKLASFKSIAVVLFISSGLLILTEVCCLVANQQLQLLSMALLISGRVISLGNAAFFMVSAYPSHHTGKMFGINGLIALVGVMLQYPCVLLLTRVFNGNFTYPTVIMLIISILSLVHPSYLFYYVKSRSQTNFSKTTLATSAI